MGAEEEALDGQEEEQEPTFNRTFSLTGKGGQPRPRRGGMRERQPIHEETIAEGQDWEPDEPPGPFSGPGEDPEMDPEEFFGRTMTLGNKPRFQSQPSAGKGALRDRTAPGPAARVRAKQAFEGASPGAGRSMTLGERKQAQQNLDGSGSLPFKKASSLAPGTRTRAEAGLYGEDPEQGALDGGRFLSRHGMGDSSEPYDEPMGSLREPERLGPPMLPLPGDPQVVQVSWPCTVDMQAGACAAWPTADGLHLCTSATVAGPFSACVLSGQAVVHCKRGVLDYELWLTLAVSEVWTTPGGPHSPAPCQEGRAEAAVRHVLAGLALPHQPSGPAGRVHNEPRRGTRRRGLRGAGHHVGEQRGLGRC